MISLYVMINVNNLCHTNESCFPNMLPYFFQVFFFFRKNDAPWPWNSVELVDVGFQLVHLASSKKSHWKIWKTPSKSLEIFKVPGTPGGCFDIFCWLKQGKMKVNKKHLDFLVYLLHQSHVFKVTSWSLENWRSLTNGLGVSVLDFKPRGQEL